MTARFMAVALLVAAGSTACADAAQRDAPHPEYLTGRWIRLRPDNSWGDTMTFSPDGTLLGSQGYPVPPSLRWDTSDACPGLHR